MLYAAVPDHEVWLARSSDGANWTNLRKPGLQAKNSSSHSFLGLVVDGLQWGDRLPGTLFCNLSPGFHPGCPGMRDFA